MYCDHRNLIHVFAPSFEFKKHAKGNMLSWQMKLVECMYHYSIEHIDGASNVWVVIVSRWGGQSMATPTALTCVSLRSDQEGDDATEGVRKVRDQTSPRSMLTVRPFRDGVFTWTTEEDIKMSQVKDKTDKPKDSVLNESELWCRIWIPAADASLVNPSFPDDMFPCGQNDHTSADLTCKLTFICMCSCKYEICITHHIPHNL